MLPIIERNLCSCMFVFEEAYMTVGNFEVCSCAHVVFIYRLIFCLLNDKYIYNFYILYGFIYNRC